LSSSSATLSLFALDLTAVTTAWNKTKLDELARARPDSRVAAMLSAPLGGHIVDGGRPAAEALAAVPAPDARAVFDALAEDHAVAGVWDAPADVVSEVFAALARVSRRRDLVLTALEAEAQFSYPTQLLEEPFVDSADARGGLVTLLADPARLEAALQATREALGLPEGSFISISPALFHELLEELLTVLEKATRPGLALVVQRTP
jgi:hypothetical protein